MKIFSGKTLVFVSSLLQLLNAELNAFIRRKWNAVKVQFPLFLFILINVNYELLNECCDSSTQTGPPYS